MTVHEHMMELAAAALDFPLGSSDAQVLSAHLAACEKCRRQAHAMQFDRDRLGGLAVISAPASVRQHVLAAALDTGSSLRPSQRPLLVLAAALLLVALAIAGVAVGARVVEFILDARLPAPTAGPVLPSESLATGSAAPSPSVVPTATPEQEWVGYRQVLVEELPMRAEPREDAELLTGLPSSTFVSAWGSTQNVDGEAWQLVHYGDLVGWVVVDTPGRASAGASLGAAPPPSDEADFLLRVDIYPDVVGPQGTLTFAIDWAGRLIRPDADGYGWTEQWLTGAGMDALDAALRESGLFDAAASYPPDGDWQGGFNTTRISVWGWNGPLTVEATNASRAPEAQALIALGEVLVSLVNSLPDAAIIDPTLPVQPHPVAAYNLLVGFGEGVLETWPQEQVTAIPLWLEDAALPLSQPLIETGALLPGQDLRCSVIDAASAAALREALWAAGYDQAPGSDVLASFTLGWRQTNGVVTVDVNAIPPGETTDCTRYGADPADAIGACVAPTDVTAVVGVADRVGCYGDSELTLEGWLVGIGTYDPVLFVEPGWLCCPSVELLSPQGGETGGGLWLLAAPDSGIELFDHRDEIVRIVGHFDDPAAMDCRYTEDYGHLGAMPGDAVRGCRQQFVVTALEVLEP